jgi:hypothetical protein
MKKKVKRLRHREDCLWKCPCPSPEPMKKVVRATVDYWLSNSITHRKKAINVVTVLPSECGVHPGSNVLQYSAAEKMFSYFSSTSFQRIWYVHRNTCLRFLLGAADVNSKWRQFNTEIMDFGSLELSVKWVKTISLWGFSCVWGHNWKKRGKVVHSNCILEVWYSYGHSWLPPRCKGASMGSLLRGKFQLKFCRPMGILYLHPQDVWSLASWLKAFLVAMLATCWLWVNIVNDLLHAEIQRQRDALMLHLVSSMFKLVSTYIVLRKIYQYCKHI